jgi:hypothetical protein
LKQKQNKNSKNEIALGLEAEATKNVFFCFTVSGEISKPYQRDIDDFSLTTIAA